MSRNTIRKKQPASNKPKRRGSDTPSSSSLNLSSDDEDGYSAVEEISDDEDLDEEDVNAVEEEAIMTQVQPSPITTPRPQIIDLDFGDDEEDEDEDNDYDVDDNDEKSSSIAPEGDEREESASWAGIVSEREDENISDFFDDAVHDRYYGAKHVRFDLPDAPSDSDSTDTEDDYGGLYSDLFVDQNHLDPAFRREVEVDPDESSGSGSFWDYGDQQDSDAEEVIRQFDEENLSAPLAHGNMNMDFEQPPVDMSYIPEPSDDLDGYETDGDTTDEEEIPEPPIRRKTRRPSIPMSDISDSELDTPRKWQRDQPRVGRFSLDRHKKPTVVLNPLTRKMMIFTPHQRRHLDLSPETFHRFHPIHTPRRSLDAELLQLAQPESPMLTDAGSLMWSAMFTNNTFADFINGQIVGAPEAFFPLMDDGESEDSFSSQAKAFAEEEEKMIDQEDAERVLNMSDLISFDDSSSSEDEDGDKNVDPTSTPIRPTTASSDAGPLGHLNSHTVGAFRRNQVNQQLILSTQATQDSLAFSGPYNHTAIRGLKADRFDVAGGQPLTPVRRRKNTITDITRSPLETVSAKRKASDGDLNGGGHKKQRSISDVNQLHI